MKPLSEIAKGRGEAYAMQIAELYQSRKGNGSMLIGIVPPEKSSWLSTADPDLYETQTKCIQPVCPSCKKIVPVRSVIVNPKVTRSICEICNSETEWQVFHNADQVDNDFWDAVGNKLADLGFILHGDDADDRYFYMSNGNI